MHPSSSTFSSDPPVARYLVWFAATLALLLGAIAALVFTLDPFQVLRPASGTANLYPAVEYQIAGVARHYPYDAVVVGTSTSNNFRHEDLQSVLGWQAMNFSNPGSTIREQHAILETALATGRVTHVLWGIDPFAFKDDPARDRHFPYYLYESGGWRRVKYFLNLEAARHGLMTLRVPAQRRLSIERWTANNTWDHQYTYGRHRVLEAWSNRHGLGQLRFAESEADARRLVDRFMLDLVAAHPGTSFDVVLLPHSVLYQKQVVEERRQEFDTGLWTARAIVGAAARYPGLRVHDLRTDTTITHDLDAYKDLSHFSGRISRQIIEIVGTGRAVTDSTAFEKASLALERDARTYEIR